DLPGYFDLIPGRYPDCIPLGVVLAEVAKTPKGQAVLGQVFDALRAKTGIELDPKIKAEILENPGKIAGALAFTPKQLSKGADRIADLFHAGTIKDAAPKVR